MRNVCCVLLVASLWAVDLASSPAAAADFSVESKLIVGKETAASTTIFRAGSVYDFLLPTGEITVLDTAHGRCVVLDPERKVKVEVTTEEVDEFMQKMKTEALARPVPLFAFLAQPKFEEAFDETTGELTLSSDWMKYQVKSVVPKQDEVAGQYAQYGNWQAKLNAVIRPGSFPPFPRLLLNESLEKRGRMPTEVELTRYGQNLGKRQLSMRAEHRINYRLRAKDEQQLEQADRDLVTFKQVTLQAFYQRPEPPAKAAEESGGQASAVD